MCVCAFYAENCLKRWHSNAENWKRWVFLAFSSSKASAKYRKTPKQMMKMKQKTIIRKPASHCDLLIARAVNTKFYKAALCAYLINSCKNFVPALSVEQGATPFWIDPCSYSMTSKCNFVFIAWLAKHQHIFSKKCPCKMCRNIHARPPTMYHNTIRTVIECWLEERASVRLFACNCDAYFFANLRQI